MRERPRLKNTISFLVATSMITEAVFGFIERPETKRAWEAFNAPTPSCDGLENKVNKYGSIVVFGIDQPDYERGPQKEDLYKAAALAYLNGYSDQIVIVGDIPKYSERKIFQAINDNVKFESKNQRRIQFSNIQFINHSYSYSQNIRSLKDYMQSQNISDIFAIANYYYINRLNLLSSNLSFNADYYAAECFTGKEMLEQIDFSEKLMIIGTAIDANEDIFAKFKSAIKEIKHRH